MGDPYDVVVPTRVLNVNNYHPGGCLIIAAFIVPADVISSADSASGQAGSNRVLYDGRSFMATGGNPTLALRSTAAKRLNQIM